MTYAELKPLLEKLREMDEVSLIELLELSSEDIVDFCIDHIIENQEKLNLYVKDEQD